MTEPIVKRKPLWQRIKSAASDLRPCVVYHGSGVIKALADEVRELQRDLARLRKGGSNRKQHEAICGALVLLRETASANGLTHADKDAAIERALEALEAAL